MSSVRCPDGFLEKAPTKFERAFALLAEGTQYARRTCSDIWDFAVEINQLAAVGLTPNDLRFLLQLKYIDHATEITFVGNDRRCFRHVSELHFSSRSCFVLTSSGALATRRSHYMVAEHAPHVRDAKLDPKTSQRFDCRVPNWDGSRNTLFFGDRIVKRFKWQAANQITVLSAFQEEGWPVRIDDPLAPSPSIHAKRRLSDTIKCLNRKQQLKLIYFRGDGTGQGVTWESAISRD